MGGGQTAPLGKGNRIHSYRWKIHIGMGRLRGEEKEMGAKKVNTGINN